MYHARRKITYFKVRKREVINTYIIIGELSCTFQGAIFFFRETSLRYLLPLLQGDFRNIDIARHVHPLNSAYSSPSINRALFPAFFIYPLSTYGILDTALAVDLLLSDNVCHVSALFEISPTFT